ncbi:MAG: DUF58 domain-containing protein [Microbacteriaceae bacterium]
MIITGWFVLLLALGAIPLVLSDGELLIWWLLLCVVLALFDLFLAASPRKLRLERNLLKKLRLNEQAQSELLLSNLSSRNMRLSIRDAWQPSAQSSPSRVMLSLPAKERRRALWQLAPSRRGMVRSAFVTIRSFGPLRLTARQVTMESLGELKVLPPFNARKHLPSRIARLRELEGQTVVMVRGQGTEFDSLRDYVRGDDVRSIDWRSTARRQEVTVRTWRPERDRKVIVVIDSGRTSAARIEDETRLDSYFESALLLSALTSHAGDHTQVLAYDRRLRLRVAGLSGPEQLSRLMNDMAEVQPELTETDWSAIPAQIAQLSNTKSLLVLLTTIDSIGASRGLLAVLPQLTQKHTVVIATVTDPDIALAIHERANRDEVYRAAAAEKALQDQDQLTAVFNRLGAEVVTATPKELPPALADYYLALKAAGRL